MYAKKWKSDPNLKDLPRGTLIKNYREQLSINHHLLKLRLHIVLIQKCEKERFALLKKIKSAP